MERRIKQIIARYDGYMVPRIIRGINSDSNTVPGQDIKLDPDSSIEYEGPLTTDMRNELIDALHNSAEIEPVTYPDSHETDYDATWRMIAEQYDYPVWIDICDGTGLDADGYVEQTETHFILPISGW